MFLWKKNSGTLAYTSNWKICFYWNCSATVNSPQYRNIELITLIHRVVQTDHLGKTEPIEIYYKDLIQLKIYAELNNIEMYWSNLNNSTDLTVKHSQKVAQRVFPTPPMFMKEKFQFLKNSLSEMLILKTLISIEAAKLSLRITTLIPHIEMM